MNDFPHSAVAKRSTAVVSDDVVAVVIPSYKVTGQILNVIARIGPECDLIYVVDDCCPDGSGAFVEARCRDPRVRVLRNDENLGVGGAVMAGYRAAIDSGASVIVKIDGDGQMAPELVPKFIGPILGGEADYTKGNRFYDLTNVDNMHGLMMPLLEHVVMQRRLADHQQLYEDASPMFRVHRDAPPFFVLHGENDAVVPHSQARSFATALRAAGAGTVSYAEIPNAHHAFDTIATLRCQLASESVAVFLGIIYGRHVAAGQRPSAASVGSAS